MSRRKSLKSLGDWIGAGGHSFDGSLLRSAGDDGAQQLDIDRLVAGDDPPGRSVLDLLGRPALAGDDHRKTAGHRLEHRVAEGVGAARKDEHIRARKIHVNMIRFPLQLYRIG